MKIFSFPFQFLLKYRERKEDRLRKELAQIKRKLEKEGENLAELEMDSITNMRELGEKHQSKEIEIALVLSYHSYLNNLFDQIKKQNKIVSDISQEMEEKRKEVIEASKGKETIKKLKEKKWAEFVCERERAEQNLIDEIALINFRSKKSP